MAASRNNEADRDLRQMTRQPLDELILRLFREGAFCESGREVASQLAACGAPAVDRVLRTLSDRPETSLHPHDLIDSIQTVLCDVARTEPDALIEALGQDAYPPDPHLMLVATALGCARGLRSIDALLAALRHRHPTVRWAAADAMIRRRSRRTLRPLIDALRDRSWDVKFSVVRAMNANRLFRDREALEPLGRIVASERIRRHSPGLWRAAREVIEKIESETRS